MMATSRGFESLPHHKSLNFMKEFKNTPKTGFTTFEATSDELDKLAIGDGRIRNFSVEFANKVNIIVPDNSYTYRTVKRVAKEQNITITS